MRVPAFPHKERDVPLRDSGRAGRGQLGWNCGHSCTRPASGAALAPSEELPRQLRRLTPFRSGLGPTACLDVLVPVVHSTVDPVILWDVEPHPAADGVPVVLMLGLDV